MSKPVLFLILESPTHPNFVALYEELGFEVNIINSMRKAMNALKTTKPAYIVCEFYYGYGNNYAGINISNMDVMLHALRKYSPQSKVIAFYQKKEKKYVERLCELFDIHAIVEQPAKAKSMVEILTSE